LSLAEQIVVNVPNIPRLCVNLRRVLQCFETSQRPHQFDEIVFHLTSKNVNQDLYLAWDIVNEGAKYLVAESFIFGYRMWSEEDLVQPQYREH
jgi:hypothetical protein